MSPALLQVCLQATAVVSKFLVFFLYEAVPGIRRVVLTWYYVVKPPPNDSYVLCIRNRLNQSTLAGDM